MKEIENNETQNKTEAGKMKTSDITVGMAIYYRGDMANSEGFGEVTEVKINKKWGDAVVITMDDERIFEISTHIIHEVDSGNCTTKFVTIEAYRAKRKKQLELIKSL